MCAGKWCSALETLIRVQMNWTGCTCGLDTTMAGRSGFGQPGAGERLLQWSEWPAGLYPQSKAHGLLPSNRLRMAATHCQTGKGFSSRHWFHVELQHWLAVNVSWSRAQWRYQIAPCACWRPGLLHHRSHGLWHCSVWRRGHAGEEAKGCCRWWASSQLRPVSAPVVNC